jgi:hypothetical protein
VNGGSFSVAVGKSSKPLVRDSVQEILAHEHKLGLDTLVPYEAFAKRVEESRRQLRDYLESAHRAGKRVVALGASTKGNVLLQYCGVSRGLIESIGEVNQDKFGCFTPGTWIPIVSEKELLATNPDIAMVLPWHFRRFFESSPRLKSTALLFPLPQLSLRPAGALV